ESIGRWKDAAISDAKWKANVASVAYIVWMQAASELPQCPEDAGVVEFLKDWSTRTYPDQFASRTVKKSFGLSRATTLLYFLSEGRFPIFDSRVRKAIKRLYGISIPNKVRQYVTSYVPLFHEVAVKCGSNNFRMVDRALFSYGDRSLPF